MGWISRIFKKRGKPRYDQAKYTPPFRVGRKQRKAVLDANGLLVIFFKDSEYQAQAYCDYLNEK